MLPLLIPIITSLAGILIPKLVGTAEKELQGAAGHEKKEWVMGFFDDLQEILVSRGILDEKKSAVWDSLEPLLSGMIENAVEAMKKAKA